MLKLVKAGLYLLLLGTAMELVYQSAPSSLHSMYDLLFGAGGLYAHVVTAVGMIMSMFVLLPAPAAVPQRKGRVRKIN